MKFVAEFRYDAAKRRALRDAFERSGFHETPDVTYHGGWISTQEHVVFILAECRDAECMEAACRKWSEFGSWTIYQVADLEDL